MSPAKATTLGNIGDLVLVSSELVNTEMTGKLTALAFPPICILRSWVQVQVVSNWMERTKLRWTPKERWTAEQSMQMNTPYVTLAQVGFFVLQSKQTCTSLRDRYQGLKTRYPYSGYVWLSGIKSIEVLLDWRTGYAVVGISLESQLSQDLLPPTFCWVF